MSINLGLARISRLLAPVPQPWKAIHIAGTNGKGSVAYYLSHLLGRRAVRAGVFTTPHLIHPRESIKCVRGPPDRRGWTLPVPISKAEYEHHVHAARTSARELLNPDEEGEATEFEILTAAAFRAFAGDGRGEAPIDVGVIECGVGGARDATNAMTAQKACTLITSLSFDHQTLLGDSLGQIAAEKAGIMREGVPCIASFSTYRKGVRSDADARQAQASLAAAADEVGTDVKYLTISAELAGDGIPVSLKGEHNSHNVGNMALAFKGFEQTCPDEWQELQTSPGKQALQDEFMTLYRPPGRLQAVRLSAASRNYNVVLDGSHNVEAAKTLDRYIKKTVRPSVSRKAGITWVIGMTKGRDADAFVRSLTLGKHDRLFAVDFPPVEGMPWIKPVNPSDILAAVRRSDNKIEGMMKTLSGASTDPKKDMVLTQVFKSIGTPSEVVVAGSLYLVSYFLELFKDKVKDKVGDEWVHQKLLEDGKWQPTILSSAQ